MPEKVVVVSDLHLGAPSSLLAFPEVQTIFVEELLKLRPITALILLGDVLDLTRAPATAWSDTTEFFRKLFDTHEPTKKILEDNTLIHYVPGNHDHHVHVLLVEDEDIVSHLRDAVLGRHEVPRLSDDLTLAPREFGPQHLTFFHGLFPESVRRRVKVWYPFMDRSLSGKPFLFHHGHYFDRKFTPLAASIIRAERGKHAMHLIEEQHWAFLESAFYLASVGRISREFLIGMCGRFRPSIDRMSLWRARLRTSKTIGGLPWNYIKNMVKSLYNKSHYTLVFGHTHRYDRQPEGSGEQVAFNTGGWIVEEDGERSDTGFLHIVDGNCEWKPVEVPPEFIQKAIDRAKAVQPEKPRLLLGMVRFVGSLRS